VLTAASLMVAADAAADAVERAQRLPNLRVGLHVVLVEGRPMLPPDQVPDLVDARGVFREDIAWAGVRMFVLPHVRRQLRAEVAAQFAAFARTGLKLDHVNSHLHFHLHPTILSAILETGRRYGMTTIRTPIEPRAVLKAVEPGERLRIPWVAAPWAELVRFRLRQAGVRSPDSVFGFYWSGAMTTPRLKGLIDHLPEGLSEIYLHPATRGGFDFCADGALYEQEAQALIDPTVIEAVRRSGAQLGGFADFV
jgi:hopanoid biosynthesis associated protein HpnK